MKRVYKYPLFACDYQDIELPVGAKILCIKLQNGEPQLWALVDPNETSTVTVTIRCAGTGHDITDENVEYIDSVIMYGDKLVFHFFKVN